LGGVGDVYLADRDPALAFQANAYGTLVVCKCCTSSQVEKMVYASTWEVYGKAVFEPVNETHPCNPETPYSISKLAGDLIARRCAAEGKMNVTVLRLGTAYGQHMRQTAVIPRFINLAKIGKPLVIEGTGNQFRQFTHATDVARAFALVISAAHPNGVFNVVSKEKVSILQLAQAIAGKYSVPLEFRSSRRGDPPSVEVSSQLALQMLGWAQSQSFSEGLGMLLADAESIGAPP
jgi:nucleoside-diphosphate-sugar epimerase